jgi:uncharacterized protein
MKSTLIVFTRYPEPNQTKTRLIPLLGAEGAANLQRQMTEHTLLQVKELQKFTDISVELRFAGGNFESMQAWLGENIIYHPQGEGDLGVKMNRAISECFNNGAKKVVVIGTDCPGIDAQLLATAFQHLDHSNLVLGPALDGGYYLIGLRWLAPELFQNIQWGTSKVWQQTMDIAQNLKLSCVNLKQLSDVDRPEDVAVWESHHQ